MRLAVGAAALGNTMEWFDFGVYAYLAGTLGKVFFPSGSSGTQVVPTFATRDPRPAAGDVRRHVGGDPAGAVPDADPLRRAVDSTVFLYETAGKPLAGSRAMVETPGQARRLVARSRTAAGRQARDLWIKLRHRK